MTTNKHKPKVPSGFDEKKIKRIMDCPDTILKETVAPADLFELVRRNGSLLQVLITLKKPTFLAPKMIESAFSNQYYCKFKIPSAFWNSPIPPYQNMQDQACDLVTRFPFIWIELPEELKWTKPTILSLAKTKPRLNIPYPGPMNVLYKRLHKHSMLCLSSGDDNYGFKSGSKKRVREHDVHAECGTQFVEKYYMMDDLSSTIKEKTDALFKICRYLYNVDRLFYYGFPLKIQKLFISANMTPLTDQVYIGGNILWGIPVRSIESVSMTQLYKWILSAQYPLDVPLHPQSIVEVLNFLPYDVCQAIKKKMSACQTSKVTEQARRTKNGENCDGEEFKMDEFQFLRAQWWKKTPLLMIKFDMKSVNAFNDVIIKFSSFNGKNSNPYQPIIGKRKK